MMDGTDLGRAFTDSSRRAHAGAVEFAELLGEPVRSGVLRALGRIPPHRVPVVLATSSSPWVYIDQIPGPQLVVWRPTGEVFEVGPGGVVGDEPVA